MKECDDDFLREMEELGASFEKRNDVWYMICSKGRRYTVSKQYIPELEERGKATKNF